MTTTCPLCGGAVTIEGKTTLHYAPVGVPSGVTGLNAIDLAAVRAGLRLQLEVAWRRAARAEADSPEQAQEHERVRHLRAVLAKLQYAEGSG